MANGIRRAAALVLIWVGLTVQMPALARGLGDLTVESFLNQPLQARIDLNLRPGEDVDAVTVRQARAEDYERLGLSQSAAGVPLRLSLDTGGESPTIFVTSEVAIRDPIMQVAVEVSWSKGRILRPYTIFLDPPTNPTLAPPPPPRQAAAAEEPESQPAAGEPAESQPPPAIRRADGVGRDPSGRVALGESYGPVGSGETLWRIASRAQSGSGVTIDQMMMAIRELNPDAFIGGNINVLKRGAILRLPTEAQLSRWDSESARREVLSQDRQWREGQVAASTPSIAPPPSSDNNPVPTVADAARSPDSPAAATAEPPAASELRLIPPADDTSGEGSAGSGDLRERLARTEEELVNVQEEKAELERRLQALESRLDSDDPTAGTAEGDDLALRTDTGVVEDESLAALEQRLADQRTDAAESDAADTPVEDQDAPMTSTTEEARTSDTGEVADSGQETESAAAAPAREPRRRRAERTPWWQSVWFIGLVVLALIAALAAWWWSRRDDDDDQESGRSYADSLIEATERDRAAAPLTGITAEAEEILRVLEDEEDEDEFGEDADDEMGDERYVAGSENGIYVARDAGAADAALTTDVTDSDAGQAESADDPETDVVAVPPVSEDDDDDGDEDEPADPSADETPYEMDYDREEMQEVLREAESKAAARDTMDPFEASLAGVDVDAADAEEDDNVPQDEDAIEVKLDLARAYLGMDDPEAARAILEEVLDEGSEAQRNEARAMLRGI